MWAEPWTKKSPLAGIRSCAGLCTPTSPVNARGDASAKGPVGVVPALLCWLGAYVFQGLGGFCGVPPFPA